MTLVERLLEKSKEAFMMAIEVYNKPSIRYRLEGFSLFICNAWELMLKAHIINKWGESAIYYPDKPSRTISLENCVQKVFTNEKAPLRLNLMKIIDLRNTSTHFITEEYEMIYIPLLQACVYNFVEKMMEFHNIDMSEIIPSNFITLTVSIKILDEAEIRAKYPTQIAEKLLNTHHTLATMIDENNSSFAIRIEHYYYQTKDRNKATEIYHIDKDAEEGVRLVTKLKDPNVTHKYTAKACIKEICNRLQKNGVSIKYHGEIKEFNAFHFDLFVKYFEMKGNERYCYIHKTYKYPTYSYSQQTIDFIVEEIKKNPDGIIDDLRAKLSKKKS